MWHNKGAIMMLAKYTDGLSLVVTRGHSWSLVVTRGHSCVLLTRPWISKTLVDEIILCFVFWQKEVYII